MGTDTDETKFRLPDLRGKFLRGVGGNSAELGATQGDAIRNITASADWFYNGAHSIGATLLGAFTLTDGVYPGNSAGNDMRKSTVLGFNASNVVPTADENRPVNMAMNYIMKY